MRRTGSVAILLAVILIPAQAQPQGRMRGLAGGDGFGARAADGVLSADALIRLQERLGLSEEQVERIKEAQEVDREARDAMRLETREMRDQLRDGEITREEFREGMQDRRFTTIEDRIAHRETLEGILTDEQLSQMQSLRRDANRRWLRTQRARQSMRLGARRSQALGPRGGFGPRAFGPPGGFGPRLPR